MHTHNPTTIFLLWDPKTQAIKVIKPAHSHGHGRDSLSGTQRARVPFYRKDVLCTGLECSDLPANEPHKLRVLISHACTLVASNPGPSHEMAWYTLFAHALDFHTFPLSCMRILYHLRSFFGGGGGGQNASPVPRVSFK